VVELVRRGERFLVSGHRAPDGDALGSALGLAAILRALGKRVDVYCPDPLPYSLAFLVREGDLLARLPDGARYDATFVTDTAAAQLLPVPFPSPEVRGTLVVLDHHAVHDDFGDLALRETDACATGEVVLRLMRDLGLSEVPKAAATPLYTAIVADTGGFRYASTTAPTLRLGAELLEAGADPWVVAYHLFEGWPRERMALLGEVLSSMRLELAGRMALIEIPRSTFDATGASADMVEGLVNYGRMVAGVEVAALLWEQAASNGGPARVRLSLRARGEVDVAEIARTLGGGGHRAAAGATVDGEIGEVSARVLEATRAVLARR
jgi:phosphoesterase RecJ-like protein